MKFKIGDKVILKLDTELGRHGIGFDRHNKVCTVFSAYPSTYLIKDGVNCWGVVEEMLQPFIKVGQQLEFSFMKEE